MRKLTVIIELENAAFADGEEAAEAARILRGVASALLRGDESGMVRDINGNVCGRFQVGEGAP